MAVSYTGRAQPLLQALPASCLPTTKFTVSSPPMPPRWMSSAYTVSPARSTRTAIRESPTCTEPANPSPPSPGIAAANCSPR